MTSAAPSTTSAHVEIVVMHRTAPLRAGAVGPDRDAIDAPESLERYLEQRRDWERVRPADLRHGTLPAGDRPGFLLTWDDGYRDFVETALPILEKHEVPAMLFVATSFVGGQHPPYELLIARLVEAHDSLVAPDGETVPLDTADRKAEGYRRIRMAARPFDPDQRHVYMETLQERNGLERWPDTEGEFLGWPELTELDRHPLVELGAHTHRHPVLTELSWRAAWREIRRGKQEMDERLGREVTAFAYPYGAHGRAVRRMSALAGFDLAFTTEPMPLAAGVPFNRHALPRQTLGQLMTEHAGV